MDRRIGFDRARLEDKILVDDDEYLVMPAVIASEIVQQYEDGWAYKPADELEKAAWTAEGRWVKILEHPATYFILRAGDIFGKVENVRFRKDLMDPKTRRPMRRGIQADIRWFKRSLPEDVLDGMRSGRLRDVSIGFTYEKDATPGEWNGQKYDYVQRDLFIDHVAAPVEHGRCVFPVCGIGVDSLIRVAMDPEETEEHIRIPVAQCEATATITISEEQGIQALYCGKEKKIRTYIFDKSKGWTMEKAQSWVNEHRGDQMKETKDCEICQEVERIGLLEASKRLSFAFGKDDVLKVLRSEKDAATEEEKEAQRRRSEKYGIAVKEGGHVTKPDEYTDVPDDEFADPVNYRYPLAEEYVQAAWGYWNKPENQEQYSAEEKAKITVKIKAAMKRHGHEVAEEGEDKKDETEPISPERVKMLLRVRARLAEGGL